VERFLDVVGTVSLANAIARGDFVTEVR